MAASHPDKVEELRALWWDEAERHGVLPLAASGIARLITRRPTVGHSRRLFEFFPGGSPTPFTAAPRVPNRAHAIVAYVTIPNDGAEGVLFTQGSRHGGYALIVHEDRLKFVYNYLTLDRFTVISDSTIPRGDVELRMEFAPTGPPAFLEGKGTPAEVRLFFNGEVVGFGELPHTVPVTFSTTGVSCGEAFFDTIDPTIYEAPFTFTGALDKVVVDISGELIVNPEAEMTRLMTQQ